MGAIDNATRAKLDEPVAAVEELDLQGRAVEQARGPGELTLPVLCTVGGLEHPETCRSGASLLHKPPPSGRGQELVRSQVLLGEKGRKGARPRGPFPDGRP